MLFRHLTVEVYVLIVCAHPCICSHHLAFPLFSLPPCLRPAPRTLQHHFSLFHPKFCRIFSDILQSNVLLLSKLLLGHVVNVIPI